MSKLTASIQTVAILPEYMPTEMYALYVQYYGGTSEEMFLQDLRDKEYVILLHDNGGMLRGFSTVALMETQWNEKPLRAIFSGDTIIHHDFWGEQVLISRWFELAGILKRQKPDIDLYWFLIVKGHRTYRLLNVFCRRYSPRRTHLAQEPILPILHHLAGIKFGDYYSPSTGLVDFGESHGHLRAKWADAEQFASRNSEVAYFLSRNPEYGRGVELACLAELDEFNLRYFALSGFRKGLYEEGGVEAIPINL